VTNHDAAVTTAQAWIARLEHKQAQGEPMDAALTLARRHLELAMAREGER